MTPIPHVQIVLAACVVAVAGYLGFSVYVVLVMHDPAMTGDVIGTWKSFAVAAFAFWIGSSSGGKAKDGAIPNDAKDAATQVAGAAEAEAETIRGREA